MSARVDDRVSLIVNINDPVVAVERACVETEMNQSIFSYLFDVLIFCNFGHLHDCQSRGCVDRIPLVGIPANLDEVPSRLVARVVHGYGGFAPRAVLCAHAGLSFRL